MRFPLLKPALCGTRYFDRIIGGQDAAKGAWPWMAYLNIVSEYGNLSCGGSILTRDTILTAAHCITISNTLIIDIFVTVGSVVAPSLLAESILVVERIIHTDYDDDNVLNDIALLKLEQPLTFTRNVRPVCLGTSGMLSVGKKIDITGWGVMNYDYGITASHLQEVTVDMIGLDTCRNMYPQFTIDDRNICTLTEDKDACSGDSGGPMVSEEGDRFFQLGLVSYGIGCASPDSPNVASSIPYFTTWIMDNIGDIICE
ncbi:Tryptase gamma [Halocaridina rubra]|uniref:Tryptase gamma n=1 Tax=Halocaridina rubra TaxID=373956 RepID=A0AAN8X2I1_HALRR